MSDNSAIEWTEATWNPVRGCSIASPGCHNCYAAVVAARFSGPGQPYEDLGYFDDKGRAHWTGVSREVPEKLGQPLRWRRPRTIFVNSTSDVFHESISDAFIRKVFAVMSLGGQHTYQVLTKRAERMARWFDDPANSLSSCQAELVASNFPTPHLVRDIRNLANINGSGDHSWPLPTVWLGVSVEDQKRADERIPHLLATPAAVRFLSVEPLLGPVDLKPRPRRDMCLRCGGGPDDRHEDHVYQTHGLDWVIVGGESGPGARPMHPAWVRSIRDQCVAAGVPFFFKQWGSWAPTLVADESARKNDVRYGEFHDRHASSWVESCLCEEGTEPLYHIGKKAAGRLLDGRTWDEMPRAAAGVM
jgi:protein gp37